MYEVEFWNFYILLQECCVLYFALVTLKFLDDKINIICRKKPQHFITLKT